MSAHATEPEPTGLFASLKRFAQRLRERLAAGARWLKERAAALLRKLRSPFAALLGALAGDRELGFGARWLMVTLVVALVLGLVLAALLSPVVGLLAFIGVGIWALVRRTRGRQRTADGADSAASSGRSEH